VEYLLSEYDFARYVYKLLDSKLFAANKEYVRRQILYCLLQVSNAYESDAEAYVDDRFEGWR
jgi:hypothetical protein